jgi:hypothetical protein
VDGQEAAMADLGGGNEKLTESTMKVMVGEAAGMRIVNDGRMLSSGDGSYL